MATPDTTSRSQGKSCLLLCIFWIAVCLILSWSGAGRFFERHLEEPILFNARNFIGKLPSLNKEMTVLQFDEATLSSLERPYLTPKEWYSLLSSLEKSGVKTILIDKVFYDLPRKASAEYYLDKISSLSVPIATALLTSQERLGYRVEFAREGKDLPLISWKNSNNSSQSLAKTWMEEPTSFQTGEKFVYGPNPLYLDLKTFKYLGHLYTPDFDLFAPIISLKNGLQIPHLALWAAKERTLVDHDVILDGVSLPVTKEGVIYNNLLHPKQITENAKSLIGYVNASLQGNIFGYMKDHVVLILNDMLPGNSAMSDTPYGKTPSSYLLVSSVNSILTKEWLRKVGSTELFIILGALLGMFFSFSGFMPLFWIGLVGVLLGSLLLAIFLFTYDGLYVSLSLPYLCFLTTSATVFSYYTRIKEKRLSLLQKVEEEKLRLESELKDAAEIAKVLMPDSSPYWPFADILVFHQPISSTSGDWYAFEMAPSKKYYHFFLCDIAGHGVQGAIIAATCRTSLTQLSKYHPELLDHHTFISTYAKDVNSVLHQQGKGTHLATMVACTFEPANDRLYFFCAGHPLPIVLSRDSKQHDLSKLLKTIPSRNNPLGLCEHLEPTLTEFTFDKKSQMILYTDGIPLGMCALQLQRKIGEGWEHKIQGPRELYEAVWNAERTKSGREPNDDVSIVWFKRCA